MDGSEFIKNAKKTLSRREGGLNGGAHVIPQIKVEGPSAFDFRIGFVEDFLID